MRPSSRPVQRALVTALCVGVSTAAMAPDTRADTPIHPTGPTIARDPDAPGLPVHEPAYLLRHSFSMAPGIAGAAKNEPASCFDVPDTDQYECRLVAGVEEAGDKRNFSVHRDDGLSNGAHGVFGHQLIARQGTIYEGCHLAGDHWFCDYQSRRPVSMRHYKSEGYVWRVFWSWQKHTRGQAGCALALNGLWSTGGWRAWTAAIGDCMNGPMERP